MEFSTRIPWPSLLFLVSTLLVMCFATDSAHGGDRLLSPHYNTLISSSNGTATIQDQLNTTMPSKIGGCGGGGGGHGGGGGWWSWGWGWSSGGGGGGGGGGRARHHRQARKGRGRLGGRGHPSCSPRLYRVGEYGQCTGRNRCRGMLLPCPLHCNGPFFYDCDINGKAHCRL